MTIFGHDFEINVRQMSVFIIWSEIAVKEGDMCLNAFAVEVENAEARVWRVYLND